MRTQILLKIYIFFLAILLGALTAITQNISLSANASPSIVLATKASFSYDGNTRTISPTITGFSNNATYAWHKDGETAPVSNEQVLRVRNVEDSGIYILSVSEENTVKHSSPIDISIQPKILYLTWKTTNSLSSKEYNFQTQYIYNGNPQGVFPFPKNAVSGDVIALSVIGNMSTNAGEYQARVISINGKDALNYILDESSKFCIFNIEKKELCVSVGDCLAVFGDALPIPKIEIQGFANDENISCLSSISYPCLYDVGSVPKEYTIGFDFCSENYSASVSEGTLSVSPKPITVTFFQSESIYGYAPNFSYYVEGDVAGFYPIVHGSIPSSAVGDYNISGISNDKNYSAIFVSNTHTIKPRRLVLTGNAVPVEYGEMPNITTEITEGSLAYEDTLLSLNTEFSSIPRFAGEYTVTAQINNQNYIAEPFHFTAQIAPKRINIKINSAISFYGESFASPSFSIEEELPYDEDITSLDFVIEKEDGRTAGEYILDGKIQNKNYIATVKTATYTIAKRSLSLKVSIPNIPLIEENSSLKFPYNLEKPIGSDKVEVSILYHKINERGIAEDGQELITEDGKYIISALLTCGQENYTLSLMTNKPFTVYPKTKTENGIVIKLENGFAADAKMSVSVIDSEPYKKNLEKMFDFQSITQSFSISVQSAKDNSMEIRIPINDENRHYTVAIEKKDGSIVYSPCRIQNGYAIFTTQISNSTFLLWKDDDNTCYLILSLLLMILLVLELIIFGKLYNKYRARKNYANAFLPFIGSSAVLGGGGIYYFFTLAVMESVLCVGFFIGILILNWKLNRFKNREG